MLSQKTFRGEAVRFLLIGIAVILSVQMFGTASHANEAQAALTGRSAAYRYEIPENLTPEEKSWFKTFQEGNMLAMGWQEITNEILAKTSPEQRPAQKIALDNLGRKIGMEWCRPNRVRKVDTSMLQEWGGILRKTAKKNPQQLVQAITYINQELDAVLD
jgi:hypothetical protein